MWTTATPKKDTFRGDGETSKGTPFVSCIFVLEGGEELEWRGYLSERAIERTKEQLVKLGWQGEPMGEWAVAADEVSVTIDERSGSGEWEGRTFRNIGWIKTSRAGSGSTAKADQLLGAAPGSKKDDDDDDIQF